MDHKDALRRAIEIVGGQSALARKCDANQQDVWYWLHKAKRGVAAEKVLSIVDATGGEVKAHELRPDIFPPPDALREAS